MVEFTARAASCQFYQAPSMGGTYDSLQQFPITWDPACINTTAKAIDIYLYSPGSAYPRIHVWEEIALYRKSYPVQLNPNWWNLTSPQTLQISIVPAGQAPFLSTLPGGPVFTATYSEPASGPPAQALGDPGITQVNDLSGQAHKMSPGKTAAAVILPLLFLALALGAYIKVKRQRGQEKRKAWTEKIDKRMSTISSDWKSVSAAGANAAIRNSIAVGNRNSSFSFGALRPSSTFGVESESEKPRTGTGVGLRNPAGMSSSERVSRVSFAPDTRVSRVSFADSQGRPSGESSRRTRAFHSAYIPPVPALPDTSSPTSPTFGILQNGRSSSEKERSSSDTPDARFSPRQTQGPLTLTPEDIRARIAGGATKPKAHGHQDSGANEYDEVMPALSMMRTGSNDPSQPDDYLLQAPSPPPAAYPKPLSSTAAAAAAGSGMSSPIMSAMPMQPMPASVMSPDEMLKAYAERKRTMSLSANGGAVSSKAISAPMPMPTPTPTGMRVLYDTPSGQTESTYGDVISQYSTYSTTSEGVVMNASRHSTNNPFALGHHPNGSLGVGSFGGARYEIGEDEGDEAVLPQEYAQEDVEMGGDEEVGMAGRGAFGGYQMHGYGTAFAGEQHVDDQRQQQQLGQGHYGGYAS